MFSWIKLWSGMAGGQISCHSPSLCSALANIRNARNLLFYWIQRRHSSSRLWWFCPQLNSRLHVEFGKFFFAVPSSARFVSYKRGSLSSSKLETSVHCYCYVCFTFIYCFVYWNCKVLQLAQIKWEKLGKQHSMSELIWNKHCAQQLCDKLLEFPQIWTVYQERMRWLFQIIFPSLSNGSQDYTCSSFSKLQQKIIVPQITSPNLKLEDIKSFLFLFMKVILK